MVLVERRIFSRVEGQPEPIGLGASFNGSSSVGCCVLLVFDDLSVRLRAFLSGGFQGLASDVS